MAPPPPSSAAEVARQERMAMLRVAWLGLGFLALFTAFNVAQSYVTTLFPGLGFISLAVIYLFYIASSLGAPYLTQRVPLNLIFLIGAALYALFILGMTWGTVPLFVCSALVGLAAGGLWVHQGYYAATASAAFGVPVGKLTSVFLAIYTVNMILGNGLSLILLNAGTSVTTVLYVMAGIAGAGAVMLFFLPSPTPSTPAAGEAPSVVADPPAAPASFRSHLGRMARLSVTRPLRDALPLILWNGSLTTLAFANYPRFIPASAPVSLQPAMFLAYGATGTLLSPMWGRLFDARGPGPLVVGVGVLGVASAALTYACILTADNDGPVNTALWVASLGVLGALDNATNSLINFSLAAWFPSGDLVAPAFAVYRLTFCVGFIVLALVSNAGAWQIIVAVNHVLMLATLVVFGRRIWRGDDAPVVDESVQQDPSSSSSLPAAAATGDSDVNTSGSDAELDSKR
ncbi:hypothetical protein BC828DRAFT_404299 [Blastocladiella britannica]|nr:hypothetical protein BC828DRAFT_404299 [Blastocladiella britannica]